MDRTEARSRQHVLSFGQSRLFGLGKTGQNKSSAPLLPVSPDDSKGRHDRTIHACRWFLFFLVVGPERLRVSGLPPGVLDDQHFQVSPLLAPSPVRSRPRAQTAGCGYDATRNRPSKCKSRTGGRSLIPCPKNGNPCTVASPKDFLGLRGGPVPLRASQPHSYKDDLGFVSCVLYSETPVLPQLLDIPSIWRRRILQSSGSGVSSSRQRTNSRPENFQPPVTAYPHPNAAGKRQRLSVSCRLLSSQRKQGWQGWASPALCGLRSGSMSRAQGC